MSDKRGYVCCDICGLRMENSEEARKNAVAEALARGLPEVRHTHIICDPCWKKHGRVLIQSEKGN